MKLPTVILRHEVLAAWLQVAGATKSQLAMQLGVSKGRVSQLFNSDVELSAHLIAKLMLVTQMPFDRLFRVASEAGVSRAARGSASSRVRSPSESSIE